MKRASCFLLAFSTLILLTTHAWADTIRQMQYNLMYYTENGAGDCDQTTNNLDTKDQAFKCIIKNVNPDILTVNEIGKGNAYAQRILDNVLNTDGVNYYAYATTVSNPSSSITIGNCLFYDTRKFALKSTFYVSTSVGYFNAYRMYYRSEELAQQDTAYITFIVSHLKAGSSYTNERYTQAQKLMSKLQSIGIADNYVLSGDFNIYNASESAYQHFVHHTNPIIRFYDPIDREGEWDNNSSFADIFTQSTHTSSNGCFSTGGMDNRFDFILVSDYILNGHQKVRCLPSTYKALGQDGLRFNKSIIDPTNTAVSIPVANALYAMSDHLPVIMDYAIDATVAVNDYSMQMNIDVVNPVSDKLIIRPHLSHDDLLTIQTYTIDGKLVSMEKVEAGAGSATIEADFPYQPAIYFVKITDQQGNSIVKKIVKATR